MLIRRNDGHFPFEHTVVALGTFDGVHIGHRALITRAVELAHAEGSAAVVYTFDGHPLQTICPERVPKQLMTVDEKLACFESLGVDGVLLRSFTREFAAVEPEIFLRRICAQLSPTALVAGFNFTFGAFGSGNAETIRAMAEELAYRAEIVEAVKDGGVTVSSTLIRGLFTDGDVRRAHRLLGDEADR